MKRKHLLTSLLTAFMAVGTWSGAWADTYVSEAYSAESTTAGWASSVDGRFTPAILSEADNYFLSVDQTTRYNNGAIVTGTALADKVAAGQDFTLSFDLRLGNSNNQTPVAFEVKDAANAANIFSLAATATNVTTWTVNGDAAKTVTLPGSGYTNASKAEDGSALLGIDWVNVTISRKGTMTFVTLVNSSTGEEILSQTLVDASTTGGVGKMVFTSRRYFANFAIDNITLRDWQAGDTPDATATTYTVRFVDNDGKDIKDPVTVNAPVGSEATATAAQATDFLLDADKWIYTGGNTTITLVEDASQNVITLTFRKANIYSYTIKAIDQGGSELCALSTGSAFEMDEVVASYPKYINYKGQLYTKDATDKSYYTTFTLDEDGKTCQHQYSMTAISGVVYCTEGENIDGATVIASGNSLARSSNAASGYAAESDLLLTTLPAGEYTLRAVGYFPNSAEGTLAITDGTNVLYSFSGSRSNWMDAESHLTLDAETTLYLAKGDSNGALDYLYIVEGDAVEKFFQADVNGRKMNFRVMNKAEKTVETYPCEEFPYKLAIELFEGETQHYITGDGNLTIPSTVVNPDDGETYRVVGIGDKSFTQMMYHNTKVTIQEGVTYIGNRGFYNNFRKKFILPSTISYIASDAFGKSWNLEVMKVGMKTPVNKGVGTGDGYGEKANATLLVPEGTKEAYAAAEYWNLFGTIKEYRTTGTVFTATTEQGIDMQFRVLDEDEMTVETYGTYETGPAIKKNTEGEIVVPAEIEGYRVVGIGGWSFRECKQMTSITLPVGITYIGHSAFRMCENLASANIPEGVDSIGERAFWNNVIPSFTLPSTMKYIGTMAFRSSIAKNNDETLDVPCLFIINAKVPPMLENKGIYFQENQDLYVPMDCKEAYLADAEWSKFRTIREIGEVDEDVKDVVSANNVTLKAGENATFTVSLTTKDTDYKDYQFNLYLPEGISIAISANGHKLVSELTDRTKVVREAGDGSSLIVAYSLDPDVDALPSGPLMEITLTVDEALADGEYTARLERVFCSTRDNQAVSLPSASLTITVEKAAEPEVPAVVTAKDVETEPAGQVNLPVFLNNPTEISGFYFDLTLPAGVTVAEGADGKFIATLIGDYAEDKLMLMCDKWIPKMGTTNNTNTWRFVALPLGPGSVLPANAGHVLNITLSVDNNMAAGVYTARLNVVDLVEAVADDEGAGSRAFRMARAAETPANGTSYASITVKGVKYGDVNGDFGVDVADIASVISFMAGDSSIARKAADVNGDGAVNVADIATIIDVMAASSRRQRLVK